MHSQLRAFLRLNLAQNSFPNFKKHALPKSKFVERIMDLNKMDIHTPVSAIFTAVPAFCGGLAYIAIGFAESIGAINPISIIEKFGIGGVFTVAVYMFIRYLLADKVKKEDKIEQLHKEEIERIERHQKELVDAIRQNNNKS